MSNRGNAKKRKVGDGGTGLFSDNDGGNSTELSAIKSMMQELVQQNNTQTNMIQSMQVEITQLSKKCMSQDRTQTKMMQSMQGDITQLTKKCNTMETTIKSVKISQSKSLAAMKTLQNKSGDMNSRFDEVNGKLKYQEILLQNQQWEYSAPRPSRDYWDGIEAGERSKAEKFLKQIKKCTEKMRYGTGDRDICLNVTPLEYNEAFLPHWKEYANALEQYHYHLNYSTEQRDNVSKLCLLGIELPPDVVYMLSNALESTRFKHFVLKNNNFGQDGIDFALKYLKTNIVMEEFTLINNTINNMDDINKLCEIVKDHPSVDMLQLLRCKGADINGYIMLKTIMNAGKNKLEVVDLCNNNISTGGSTFIQDFLATNPKKLESLYLEGNELDDQDAIGIVEALKQNTHLRFLRLTNNNITKTGWEALRKVEFGDTSLNAAADSNHTCVTKYPPEGSDVIEGLDISEMNGDRDCENAYPPPYARQKKIYSILSSRNRDRSNVKNFDNIPVELLPNILHSIQKYSNYHVENEDISQVRGHVQPLSIVHEICRHWDESLAAFEALSS